MNINFHVVQTSSRKLTAYNEKCFIHTQAVFIYIFSHKQVREDQWDKVGISIYLHFLIELVSIIRSFILKKGMLLS